MPSNEVGWLTTWFLIKPPWDFDVDFKIRVRSTKEWVTLYSSEQLAVTRKTYCAFKKRWQFKFNTFVTSALLVKKGLSHTLPTKTNTFILLDDEKDLSIIYAPPTPRVWNQEAVIDAAPIATKVTFSMPTVELVEKDLEPEQGDGLQGSKRSTPVLPSSSPPAKKSKSDVQVYNGYISIVLTFFSVIMSFISVYLVRITLQPSMPYYEDYDDFRREDE